MKEKFAQSQALLASIINSSDDAILSKTLEGTINSWNPGAEKIFGYTSEEIIGRNISVLIPAHLQNEESEIMEKIRKGKKIDHYETERLKKNGQTIDVSLIISPIKDSHGNIVGASKILRDITARKEADGRLAAGEERFRHTLDNMLEGIQIHDFNWHYTYVNDTLVRYSKSSREELLGYSLMEKYPGIEQSDLFKTMKRCMDDRVTEHLETEFVFPDGTKADFELSIQPVPEGLFILSIDITLRKIAEIKLEKAHLQMQESLWKIFNASPSGMILTDIESRKYVEVNKNFLKTFGYSREEAVGLTASELGVVSKESQRKLAVKLQQYGYLKNEDILCYAKGGTEINCIVSVDLFEMEGKKYFLSIYHDITDIKEMRRKAAESEEKFRKAFQVSAAGISISRLSDGAYLEVNDSFIQMTGYSKEELIGHTAIELEIIKLEKREEILKQIREQGSARHVEITVHNKSGATLVVLSSVETILINDEKYMINIIYDITDRKRTEEQLVFANNELEAFSYSVSHDLRAPLRGIHGYTKILEEDYFDKLDDEGKKIIETILRNAKIMGELIDDLLAFSRLGRKEISKRDIHMNSLARSVADEFISASSENKIEIIIKPLPPGNGDHALIKQVLVNLISNAVKYSGKKSKTIIEIGSYFKENKNVYYVKDNGAGFDMKYYHKLFGVFQRLHSQAEFEGTGVGLAIIQRIIQKHQGDVWAESTLNEGATFYFSLETIQQ